MIYFVNINNKEYEVEVEKGQANLIKTTEMIPQVTITEDSAVKKQNTSSSSLPVITENNSVGKLVSAPMPGTILDIKASIGTIVEKGQMILVLEAMKMENEIFAPISGVITQILVSKGTAVSTNDTMMIIQ